MINFRFRKAKEAPHRGNGGAGLPYVSSSPLLSKACVFLKKPLGAVREIISYQTNGDVEDFAERFDIHFSAALEDAYDFLISDTGFQKTTFQKNEAQALAGSRWTKVYRKNMQKFTIRNL